MYTIFYQFTAKTQLRFFVYILTKERQLMSRSWSKSDMYGNDLHQFYGRNSYLEFDVFSCISLFVVVPNFGKED